MTRPSSDRQARVGIQRAQLTLDAFMRGETEPKRPRLEAAIIDRWSLPPPEEKTETRGRPTGSTKYVVRVMPDSTRKRIVELLRGVNSDADTMRRLMKHLEEFKAINHIERADLALFSFVVDIGQQGLKASTCKSYTKLILEGASRAGEPIKGPLVGDLLKALSIMEAMDDVEHAPDVDYDILEGILRGLPQGRFRLTFYVLLFTGCRAADACRLDRTSFSFNPDGTMRVFFRITKNRRSKADSFAIAVRPPFVIPELVDLVRGDFGFMECSIFNRELLALGHNFTSYTLRRAFINRTIEEKTVGSVTEWCEVARLTGHMKLETLRNSYTRSAFDRTL